MAKAQSVPVTGVVRSIVSLDEERTVSNKNGLTKTYTHRMYLRGQSIANAARQLASMKNEDGKSVSIGALMDDGTVAIDLSAQEVSRAVKLAGADTYRDLVGANYEGTFVFRPAGSEYVNRKTGETGVVDTTHAVREGEMFELSQAQLIALKAAQLMLKQQTKQSDVFVGFSFNADGGNEGGATGSESFEVLETPVVSGTAEEATTADKKKQK
jgi:hypothetical protein